jgi:hypothetical protein
MDAPDPVRCLAVTASASGAGGLISGTMLANWNGPCRLAKSPQPALAVETNVAIKIPAPIDMLIAREIAFMKFLFSAAVHPHALSKAQSGGENWNQSEKKFTTRACGPRSG